MTENSLTESKSRVTHRLPSIPMLVVLQGGISAASLVVEIVAGRMLAPYVGMSLYTWTAVIAVVLAGFSAGHWWGGRIAERPAARALRSTAWAMIGAALFTGGSVILLRWAGALLPHFSDPLSGILALTLLAFFLPSLFAGIPAPVLAQISVSASPDASGRALGAMFAAGAVGAIAGTVLAGFVFISWLGSVGTILAVTLFYALSATLLFRLARRAGGPVTGPTGAAMSALAVLGVGLSALQSPSPCTTESQYFCIRSMDVSADPAHPVWMMVLDHLVHGMTARELPHVMFTDHAALLDELARARHVPGFSAFFIGGGTFSIPRSWAALSPAPRMTVAEIDPVVTDIAARDFWFDPASARVLNMDARRALLIALDRYDVILGDAFTDIAVPSHLITQEFFQLVQSRLTPGGTYLMNVIDHADRLETLVSLAHTLQTVFPVVEIWTEAKKAGPQERMICVLAAGDRPTPRDRIETLSPDPILFARLPDGALDRLGQRIPPTLLTDDFAPIDRLMGLRL
ncbi:MAG: fused MFS/spermidine synthase [Thalassovita sp.]